MELILYQTPDENESMPYYIHGIGIDYKETDMRRPEGFYRPQFIMISKGSGTFCIADKKFDLQKGSVMYIPKDIGHSYEANVPEWRSWMSIIQKKSHWICSQKKRFFQRNIFAVYSNNVFISHLSYISTD